MPMNRRLHLFTARSAQIYTNFGYSPPRNQTQHNMFFFLLYILCHLTREEITIHLQYNICIVCLCNNCVFLSYLLHVVSRLHTSFVWFSIRIECSWTKFFNCYYRKRARNKEEEEGENEGNIRSNPDNYITFVQLLVWRTYYVFLDR